jgi:hypothetical protein
VEQWLNDVSFYKERSKKESRVIYFGDEAGFHSAALYGGTWAPIEHPSCNRPKDKVNCILAITIKFITVYAVSWEF